MYIDKSIDRKVFLYKERKWIKQVKVKHQKIQK